MSSPGTHPPYWEHDGIDINIQPDGSGVHKFHCLCPQGNGVMRELWALTLPGLRQMIDQCRASELVSANDRDDR